MRNHPLNNEALRSPLDHAGIIRRMRPLLRLLPVLLLAAVLVACGNPARIPSEDDAQAVLDEAQRRAREGADSLCTWEGVSPGRCEDEFAERGGLAAVPDEPPVTTSGCGFPADDDNAAYRVLLLEGEDGKGVRYKTGFVVRDAGSHGFVPQSPVYWSGVGFSQSRDTGAPPFACPEQ